MTCKSNGGRILCKHGLLRNRLLAQKQRLAAGFAADGTMLPESPVVAGTNI